MLQLASTPSTAGASRGQQDLRGEAQGGFGGAERRRARYSEAAERYSRERLRQFGAFRHGQPSPDEDGRRLPSIANRHPAQALCRSQ